MMAAKHKPFRMPIRSGELRMPIVILERSVTELADGSRREGEPTIYCTRRAKVLPITGKEYVQAEPANQVQAVIYWAVTVRQDETTVGITELMRVRWTGRGRLVHTGEILRSFDPDQRGQWWTLHVAERRQ